MVGRDGDVKVCSVGWSCRWGEGPEHYPLAPTGGEGRGEGAARSRLMTAQMLSSTRFVSTSISRSVNLRIRTARIRRYVLASEVAGSAFVREVLAAIGLEREPQPRAVEVEDERAKSVLPPKFRRGEPAITLRRPEPPFRVRAATPQLTPEGQHGENWHAARMRARSVMAFSTLRASPKPPSPQPSPSRRERETGSRWPPLSWRCAQPAAALLKPSNLLVTNAEPGGGEGIAPS